MSFPPPGPEAPTPALATPERQQDCPACRAEMVLHTLKPTVRGCAWVCDACNNAAHAYTRQEMMEQVMRKFFHIPVRPEPCEIPAGFRVFIEHKGEGTDSPEEELAARFVEEHVQVTGRLPSVGKPVFIRPPGVDYREMALPMHKVVRIDEGEGALRPTSLSFERTTLLLW